MGHVPGLIPAQGFTEHECVLGSMLVWSLFWPSTCPWWATLGLWLGLGLHSSGASNAWEGGKCVSKRQNIKDPMCVYFVPFKQLFKNTWDSIHILSKPPFWNDGSVVFRIPMKLWIHSHYLIPGSFHYPQRDSVPVSSPPHCPLCFLVLLTLWFP